MQAVNLQQLATPTFTARIGVRYRYLSASTPLAPHTHKVAGPMVVRQSIRTIPERKIYGLRNISLFHPSVFGHGSWVRLSIRTFKDDGKSTVGGMAVGHGLDVGVGCEAVGIFFQVIIF
jgi:hypothetical protein